MSSPVEVVCYDDAIVKMIDLHKHYKKERRGYRKSLYQTLAGAAHIAFAICKDKKIKREFLRADRKHRTDVLHIVICAVVDGPEQKTSQTAWKYSRAVSYLVGTQKTKPADVASELAKRGIEKLARAAAENDPRRQVVRKSANSRVLGSNSTVVSSRNAPPMIASQFSTLIGLSEQFRPKISSLTPGMRVKIIAVRRDSPSGGGALLKVTKVARLKRSADDLEWE